LPQYPPLDRPARPRKRISRISPTNEDVDHPAEAYDGIEAILAVTGIAEPVADGRTKCVGHEDAVVVSPSLERARMDATSELFPLAAETRCEVDAQVVQLVLDVDHGIDGPSSWANSRTGYCRTGQKSQEASVDSDIRTRGGIVVPATAVTWRFSRATGPGGQGVNTTDSRVELVVDLTSLEAADDVRERIVAVLGRALRIVASAERSQLRNREAAQQRLIERLDAAARRPERRSATHPTRGSVRERLEEKRQRSQVKSTRRPPNDDPSRE
jgi:ribosome-associated protein